MEDGSSTAGEVITANLKGEVEENEQVVGLRPVPSSLPPRPPSSPSRPLSPPPPPKPPTSLNKSSMSSESHSPPSSKALPPAGRPSLTFGPPPSRPSVSSATPTAPPIAIRDLWMGSAGLVEEEQEAEGDEGEQQEVDADEGDIKTPGQTEIAVSNVSQASSVSSAADALGTISLSSEPAGLSFGAPAQPSKDVFAPSLSGFPVVNGVSGSVSEATPPSSSFSNISSFSDSNSSLSTNMSLSNVSQNSNAFTSHIKESKQEDDEDDEKSGPVDKYGRPIRAAADVKKKRIPGGREATPALDSSSTIPFIFAPMHLRTSEGFVPGNASESSGKKLTKKGTRSPASSTRSPASSNCSPSSSASFSSAFSVGGESLPSFSDAATASLGSFSFSSSFGSPSSDFIFPTSSSGSGPLFGGEFKHSDFAAAAQHAASNENASQANSTKEGTAE